MNLTIEQRAKEIADFLGKDYGFCLAKLQQGFGPLHNEVTADWNRANPKTDEEILEWYRTTEAYIFELSAYHLDRGFAYMNMINGVALSLRAKGSNRIMCLGDGVGDLTACLMSYMFDAIYHDLDGSRTAQFAESIIRESGFSFTAWLTQGWAPNAMWLGGPLDAIVSLDFLEHVTDVETWVRAIFAALKPGGWLVAQNAFNCGSGPNGSIPCHLERNDRFEKDWDPLLLQVGFVQETSNWYQKPL